jgi:glycosyltransferase involved in cell wall biosynthesis
MIPIVVPCFNEAKRLDMQYWRAILTTTDVSIYFVDDGSTDGTLAILNELSDIENCFAISSQKNLGKANAIRYGMQYIQETKNCSSIGFIDADGAFELNDISRILEIWQKGELINGEIDSIWTSRVKLSGRNIERKSSRHYISRVVATYLSLGNSKVPYDTQCGFKIFKNDANLKSALKDPFQTRWFFDLELLARLTGGKVNYSIYEEPLNNWKEISGSKIRKTHYLKILLEILKVKKQLDKI